jgi:hypothetical protein
VPATICHSPNANWLLWLAGAALLLMVSVFAYLSVETPAGVGANISSPASPTGPPSSTNDPGSAATTAQAAASPARVLSESEWEQLIENLDVLRARYRLLDQKRLEIARQGNINDPDPQTLGSPIVSIIGRPISLSTENITRLQRQVAELEASLEYLERLRDDQLPEALAFLEIEDSTSSKLLANLKQCEARETALSHAGFPPDHPDLQPVRNAIEVYRKSRADQLASIRRAQRTKLAIQKVTLQSAEERYATMVEEARVKKPYLQAYLAVKTEQLDLVKDLRTAHQAHQEAEKRGLPASRVRQWRRVASRAQ